MDIMVGMKGIVEDMVETADTAAEVGSGSLLVYATPCMVAMMEGAACEAIDPVMPEGHTSVGIALSIEHLAATPVGMEVRAEATVTAVEGKIITFELPSTRQASSVRAPTSGALSAPRSSWIRPTQSYKHKAAVRRSVLLRFLYFLSAFQGPG